MGVTGTKLGEVGNELVEIDRVPLTLNIDPPQVDLQITVLSVDSGTLVTQARLTNIGGDDLTDLTLDVVDAETGIPVDVLIQPDIRHTYLRAGQSMEIAFVPLNIQTGGIRLYPFLIRRDHNGSILKFAENIELLRSIKNY